ncbi:hypothetical protein FE697_006915 [Mumia zhuanghuii]|uniref:Uncharacterized protein n=2 Tax=Mumia TaxID=1546255 RepID=A0ABW1QN16_9ACTN|nr:MULTISPECIES: hypothetical protein [Mumia]KAA1423340.1 hypothetical protein FE697_006915 [Mumia zhuanghuii]
MVSMQGDAMLTIRGELPSAEDLSEVRGVEVLTLPRGVRSLDFLAPVIRQLEVIEVPEGSKVRADFSVLEAADHLEVLDLAGAVPTAELDLAGLHRLQRFVLPSPRQSGHHVVSALANPHLRTLELQHATEHDLDLVRAPLERLHIWRASKGIAGMPASMPLGSLTAIQLYRMPEFDFGWIERAVDLKTLEVWRVGHLRGLRHLVDRAHRLEMVSFDDCPQVDEPELATQVDADRFLVMGRTNIDREAVDRAFPLPDDWFDGEPLESFWSFGPFGSAAAMEVVERVERAATPGDVAAIVDPALARIELVGAERDTVRASIAAAAVVAAALGAVFEEPPTLNGAFGTPLELTYTGPSRWGPGSWAPSRELITRAHRVIADVAEASDPEAWANLLEDPTDCFDVIEALESSRTALERALAGSGS